jgi:hypothetical protein
MESLKKYSTSLEKEVKKNEYDIIEKNKKLRDL